MALNEDQQPQVMKNLKLEEGVFTITEEISLLKKRYWQTKVREA